MPIWRRSIGFRTPRLVVAVVFALSLAATRLVPLAGVQIQKVLVGEVDPERCDECQQKTLPDARWDMHGELRWYSDADAINPARADPLTDRHCFIRSVQNRSASSADYKWAIGGLENSRLESRMVDKRCGGAGGVASPPVPGPILVNFIKPDGSTYVWKSVDDRAGAQSAAVVGDTFPELWTTIDTQLYQTDGRAERMKLKATSRVQRLGSQFQYSYVVTRPVGGTASYTLTWAPAESPMFVQTLRSRGLYPLDIRKFDGPSLTITFAADQPPRRIEGPLKLSQLGGSHVFTTDVVTWAPPQ